MQTPSITDMFRVFGRIGLLSFGGPAAQISLMHTELVDRRNWLSEQQFLGSLSFCMLLPGPEAMQLATYAGWRLRGIPGGLLAGMLFVLPGAVVIFALAAIYAYFGQLPIIRHVFAGIQAAVVIIVLAALLSLSRRALQGWDSWMLAFLSFMMMFFLSVPFPLIIASAALWGILKPAPGNLDSLHEVKDATSLYKTIITILILSAIWVAPLFIAKLFNATFLFEIGVFFSKLAVVTFGGAYAVLGYMTQDVVITHGWLTTAQMIDALGLAETTPGPLILVTQFVALIAGFQQGGISLALAAGFLTLWVTFTPCFLWIFAGAPYIDALLARPRLKSALSAISAAVVGVILNLSVWFALHVLFATVTQGKFGPLPEISSFSALNAALIFLAAIFMLGFKLPMIKTLGLMMVVAGGTHFLS
jgi:chromate transporter